MYFDNLANLNQTVEGVGLLSLELHWYMYPRTYQNVIPSHS